MKLKIDRMSIYQLKQLFSLSLQNELRDCNFIIIRYEVNFTDRLCYLKILKNGKLELIINLNYINKALPIISCSLMIKVFYCVYFIVQFLSLLESAKRELPKSYFEGLVFCNAIEICNEKKAELYSPISFWNKKNKGSHNIRPIEINCAIKALAQITESNQLELNDQDKAFINSFRDNLLLYSNFPEISYVHKKIPVYTIFDSLKTITKQIEKNPSLIDTYPVLSLISFRTIKKLTIEKMFLHCAESNDAFMMGIAIRLIAFFNINSKLNFKMNVYEVFINELQKYICSCANFYDRISKQDDCFFKENFIAIKKVIKEINRFLSMNDIAVMSNNIHFAF